MGRLRLAKRIRDLNKMILYFSCSKLKNSVNAVYIKGLVKNGKKIEAHEIKSFKDFISVACLVSSGGYEFIMVGYDSPQLVTFCRLFTRKKIIYNALCSVYERLIIARYLHQKFSLYAVYYWLLDFFAVSSANLVMLETNAQIDYFVKVFKFTKNKFIRAWTGTDEDNFFYDASVDKFPTFTVLFRGALVPEAGAEYVVKTAKILESEDVKFLMLSGGLLLNKINKLVKELNPSNLELRSDLLSEEELRTLMQKCHLSLGQLSYHSRLKRTVPHKAYESLALKLPYLTASNRGVLELLRDGKTCITCKPADSRSLAEKVLWANNHQRELEQIAENGHRLYTENLTPKFLANRLLLAIKSL